jgi:hypothetical protein
LIEKAKAVTLLNRFITVLLIMLAWNIPGFCGEIHDAAASGNLAKVKELVELAPALLNAKSESPSPDVPLHSVTPEKQHYGK